jgi:hypothetical protein
LTNTGAGSVAAQTEGLASNTAMLVVVSIVLRVFIIISFA